MYIIADLQLHSRFSRAVSKEMTLPNIAMWARRKGIGLVATGDWTHPIWFRDIERDLEEMGNGLLRLKPEALGGSSFARSVKVQTAPSPSVPSAKAVTELEKTRLPASSPLFLLATEVSCIYSQGGRMRRIHTLIWVPTLDAARKINQEMTKRGCNLLSDGRPIIGLTSIQLAELVLSIEPKALIIPAHCLLPESMVLTDGFIPKQIQVIHEGDRVLSHNGTFQSVLEVKKRAYSGEVITVKPWYFRPGLTTTPEHPYWAIRTIKKCPSTGDICRPSKAHLRLCQSKACLSYKPTWQLAQDLAVGDVLIYPRPKKRRVVTAIRLSRALKGFWRRSGVLSAGGTRGRNVPDVTSLTPELGRLLGYYIAEGTTDGRNSFSFTFSNKEKQYLNDLLGLVKTVFGLIRPRIYRRPTTKSIEITFASKIHAAWFAAVCYQPEVSRKAANKCLPRFLLDANDPVQAEFLRGWYRGDKGYTSSRILMNQIKTLCLQLGIIPSVIVDTKEAHWKRGNHKFGKRTIHARSDSYAFSNFAFFDDRCDLKKEIKRSQTKLDRRHGWIDKNFIYLPIKDIERHEYKGEVYNLEVAHDHSYVTEFAAVHNCWTPWFSLYGSMSGFDSIEEAFGPYAKNIYAVETGLSSSPAMNWRIKELDNRAIVSFSDAHSGPKLGREATVFNIPDGKLSYDMIYQAIRGSSAEVGASWFSPRQGPNLPDVHEPFSAKAVTGLETTRLPAPSISYTIEFYPEEGKYHYTGHRTCQVRQSPAETNNKGTTCPVCGKPLTVGVMHRVEQLATRSEGDLKLSTKNYELNTGNISPLMIFSEMFPSRPPFVMLVPLLEIIAEAIGAPLTSPKVQTPYFRLTEELAGEYTVLLTAETGAITKLAGERVAHGIEKVRQGEIIIDPGYDGVFGVVKIWKEGTGGLVDTNKEQLTIF